MDNNNIIELLVLQDSTRSMARYTGRDGETGQGSATGCRNLHGEDRRANQAAQSCQNTVSEKGECVYSLASGRRNLHWEDHKIQCQKKVSDCIAWLQAAKIYMEKIAEPILRCSRPSNTVSEKGGCVRKERDRHNQCPLKYGEEVVKWSVLSIFSGYTSIHRKIITVITYHLI